MVSLLSAARAVADNLGGFGVLVCTEAAGSGDPDARRTLISSELVDPERDPTSFNDLTLYAAGGLLDGEQLAVMRDSFDGDAGKLYSSGLWSSIPQVGQEIEFHARMPRRRHFGEPGLREMVNEALGLLSVTAEAPMTGSGSTAVDAPAWLSHPGQVIGAATPGPNGPLPSGRTVQLVSDAGRPTPYLRLSSAYAAGEAWTLLANRPASTWIKPVGGAGYAESTVGLVDDGDEAAVGLPELVTVATWRACRALARRAPDFESGAWRNEELLWEARAAYYLQWGRGGQAIPLGGMAAAPLEYAKGWAP